MFQCLFTLVVSSLPLRPPNIPLRFRISLVRWLSLCYNTYIYIYIVSLTPKKTSHRISPKILFNNPPHIAHNPFRTPPKINKAISQTIPAGGMVSSAAGLFDDNITKTNNEAGKAPRFSYRVERIQADRGGGKEKKA